MLAVLSRMGEGEVVSRLINFSTSLAFDVTVSWVFVRDDNLGVWIWRRGLRRSVS